MKIISSNNRADLRRLLAPRARADRKIENRVRTIVDRVRTGGDRALAKFAKEFGDSGPIEVSYEEMQDGAASLDPAVRRALRQAAQNLRRVASRQLPKSWKLRVATGVSVEQRMEPLARVGCYVPGGRYPLASSLLMTAIPARVAGVREIIVVCPRPGPAVMAAAVEARVKKLFRVGGAHAIAALAYGTKMIPRVDKIVGPGNRYVTAAKALVARDCAIDFCAGPTEIVIVASSGKTSWIAADLVAQAEHDPDARAILITWSRSFAESVVREVARLTSTDTATRALARRVAIIAARSAEEAVELANKIAPEHLVIDRERLARRSLVAGTVFVGPHSAQAAGDYATGSNHVLPTGGGARFRGGLSAADFVRVMSIQRVSRTGLRHLAATVIPLARAEGLNAHARSIEMRLAYS